jgi:hypothetical protein
MIYFIRDPLTKRVKIGSAADPWSRLVDIQTGSSTDLCLAAIAPGGLEEERALHGRFAALRIRGEWFAEASDLAEYIRSLPVPVRPGRRWSREPKTPLDAWMMENRVSNKHIGDLFGYGQAFVSQMRHGVRQPTLDVACELADLTGLHPRDFVVIAPHRAERAKAA